MLIDSFLWHATNQIALRLGHGVSDRTDAGSEPKYCNFWIHLFYLRRTQKALSDSRSVTSTITAHIKVTAPNQDFRLRGTTECPLIWLWAILKYIIRGDTDLSTFHSLNRVGFRWVRRELCHNLVYHSSNFVLICSLNLSLRFCTRYWPNLLLKQFYIGESPRISWWSNVKAADHPLKRLHKLCILSNNSDVGPFSSQRICYTGALQGGHVAEWRRWCSGIQESAVGVQRVRTSYSSGACTTNREREVANL